MINKETRQHPIIYTGPVSRTAIGWGAHTTVANECKAADIKKALMVTTGLKGTGIVEEIKGILEQNYIATELYSKVTSNPKDYQIMEAYQIFKESGCDGIVSVGGGSSHDCGKGVRLVATNDGMNIRELTVEAPWTRGLKKLKPIAVKQVAVNTTAGTNAETSANSSIVNTELKRKLSGIALGIAPAIGIIDPLLIRLMPQDLTAWTGCDAFAHAFETYLGGVYPPERAACCLKVVQLVAENLREFSYNRMNHEACENMCYAESMSRVILGTGGGPAGKLSLHEAATQIGGITDCHHGRVIGILMLPVQLYNKPTVPDRFAEMARAMGVDTRGMTRIQAADKWFDEVERLLKDLNIQTGHLSEQVGLRKEDLEGVATRTVAMRTVGTPSDAAISDVIKILKAAL